LHRLRRFEQSPPNGDAAKIRVRRAGVFFAKHGSNSDLHAEKLVEGVKAVGKDVEKAFRKQKGIL
jgi:hypothetical protein